MNLAEPGGGDLAPPHPRPLLLAVEGRDIASSKLLPLSSSPESSSKDGACCEEGASTRLCLALGISGRPLVVAISH